MLTFGFHLAGQDLVPGQHRDGGVLPPPRLADQQRDEALAGFPGRGLMNGCSDVPGDLDGWLGERGVLDGQPFLISPDGRYDVMLNRYFEQAGMSAVPWNTQAAHARDLVRVPEQARADLGDVSSWPGVHRAGLPKAEPGAGAGLAAP